VGAAQGFSDAGRGSSWFIAVASLLGSASERPFGATATGGGSEPTSRDFLRELSYGDLPGCRTPVSQAMSDCQAFADPEDSLEEVRSQMHEPGMSFIAVTKGHLPLGVVSLRDLRGQFESADDSPDVASLPVKSILGESTPTLKASATLGNAAAMMLDRRTDALAIVSRRHHLVGLLSEDDVLRAMLPDFEKDSPAEPVTPADRLVS